MFTIKLVCTCIFKLNLASQPVLFHLSFGREEDQMTKEKEYRLAKSFILLKTLKGAEKDARNFRQLYWMATILPPNTHSCFSLEIKLGCGKESVTCRLFQNCLNILENVLKHQPLIIYTNV